MSSVSYISSYRRPGEEIDLDRIKEIQQDQRNDGLEDSRKEFIGRHFDTAKSSPQGPAQQGIQNSEYAKSGYDPDKLAASIAALNERNAEFSDTKPKLPTFPLIK